VTNPGGRSTGFIAGAPVAGAIPIEAAAPTGPPADSGTDDPGADDTDGTADESVEEGDQAADSPADDTQSEDDTDMADQGGDAAADGEAAIVDDPAAVVDETENADEVAVDGPVADHTSSDSSTTAQTRDSEGGSAGALLAAGLTAAGFGVIVTGVILWRRKQRSDEERAALFADAHERIEQGEADNAENDRLLYQQLIDAAIASGESPDASGMIQISKELYDSAILFGHSNDKSLRPMVFDNFGDSGREFGDPNEFATYDHFSIDVETLEVRTGWDEKQSERNTQEDIERRRDAGEYGGPPQPGDPEFTKPIGTDENQLPPA
jgi:hypothetical protein